MPDNDALVKMLIPKGRMFQCMAELLRQAGYDLTKDGSSYRPFVDDPQIQIKIVKAQNIGKLVESGGYDLGITGYDWIVETNSKVVELSDLGLYRGKVIAAAPRESKIDLTKFNGGRLSVASEFESLSKGFLENLGINYDFIRTWGATEAFPPEDSNIIVDSTFSGKTLEKNNLEILGVVLETTARLVSNKQSLNDESKRAKIYEIAAKLGKILEGGFDESSFK